jgi:valyl-tRNA synthetase
LADIEFVESKQNGVASFMVGTTDFYIPLGDMLDLDVEREREKIMTDLEYYRGFLESVMKKLNNERFVKNAPANVLELEKKKKNDTEQKIKSLSERLKELKN